jgi:Protein of unknown function (DUF3489)
MPNSENQEITNTCEGFGSPTDKPCTKLAKTDRLLKLLKSKRGATLMQLQVASGWQAHSVRGFLSGTVKKKLGLTLLTETRENGARRYRIAG